MSDVFVGPLRLLPPFARAGIGGGRVNWSHSVVPPTKLTRRNLAGRRKHRWSPPLLTVLYYHVGGKCVAPSPGRDGKSCRLSGHTSFRGQERRVGPRRGIAGGGQQHGKFPGDCHPYA